LTFTIPVWLLWVAGGIGAVVLGAVLVFVGMLAFMGYAFANAWRPPW